VPVQRTLDRASDQHHGRIWRPAFTCASLVLLGMVLALQTTIPAKAGACDNQTVSTSDRDRQLSTAVLINEIQTNPFGERHAGSVCWSLEVIKAAGQPDNVVVHADVDIPDHGMKVVMDFSRNPDRSAEASHYVSLTFEQPSNVAGGEVVSVPGMLLKNSERSKGMPFAALATKTAKGSFLVGLSNRGDDRRRNLQLLRERSWFDIPMVYASQHRGILAVEKGNRGEQVFREAMAHWERTP
jgi:hypothetical protein